MENIIDFLNNISGDEIISFILEPEFDGIFLIVKIIFVIISSILIGGIIFLLTATDWFQERYSQDIVEIKSQKAFDTQKDTQKWGNILKRLKLRKEAEYKMAVIQADALFNNLLERKGIMGETMAEKLKKINSEMLKNINDVWEAHKVRNDIVHSPDQKIGLAKAKKAVNVFKQAFDILN
ncbi:MAG: hypothetical protein ABH956_00940 [Candidatus Nealsonbacteria bacterium]